MTIFQRIEDFNNKLAIMISKHTGSMYCAYLFMVWAILPLLWPASQTVVFYVSSAILQLVLLPVILLAGNIQGEKSEIRAQEDHDYIQREFNEIKELHEELNEVLQILKHPEIKQAIENLKNDQACGNGMCDCK
jgi:low affinity Fe/Cu permease